MNTQRLISLALYGTLALGCGSSTTTPTSNDLAMPADLATAPVADMTKPADMVTPPADMTTPVYNGCTTALFMDQSAAGASRAVAFGGALGTAYSPRCILISAGQTVTFNGAFTSHPLRPGVGAVATTGSPNNPIAATSTGTTAAFTFPTAGQYPFNCMVHDGGGMNGVVQVK